jgi:hypothetical protein
VVVLVSAPAHHLVGRLVLQEINDTTWGMRRTSITDLNDLTNIEPVQVTTNVVKSAFLNTCAGCVLESHTKHEWLSRTVTT